MKNLCDRAELVGGIKLPVPVLEIVNSAVANLTSKTDFVSKIVLITALHMDDFAEYALSDHPQKRHLVAVIAAIFKQHTELAGLLRSSDKLPALLD